jgi:hypothetical protein
MDTVSNSAVEAQDATSELQSVVERSKEVLLNEAPKGKRKPGRPRKTAEVQAEPIEAPVAPYTSMQPILKPVVQIPFEIVAEKTAFHGWRLEDAQADILATSLDNVCREYFPQLSGEGSALVLFFLNVLMIGGVKYIEFQAFQKEKLKNPEKPNGVS